jgi:5'-phosphate synthase pdxT subunit
MRIGVLALQGAFIEHMRVLKSLGVDAMEVRKPGQISNLDGLIIPGGESTTVGKLATAFGLIEPIRAFCCAGKSVWGTCAGMILFARDGRSDQPRIGVMDVRVERNAFGRQVESFEIDLDIPVLTPPAPFRCVFIRAPRIERADHGIEVLARLPDGAIVAARQGNVLVTSFHPELTNDNRFHRFFVRA